MATSEEIVAQLEETFKDRYTEKDEEYTKTAQKEPMSPPVMSDWGSSSRSRHSDERHHRDDRDDRHSSRRHRSRSRSRSRSPPPDIRKREGKFGIMSFYVNFY